jgi:hypothetical protein
MEPPLDTEEIVARLRFSLDEPLPLSAEARKEFDSLVQIERRRMRSMSLQVTSRSMPDIHAMVLRVCERLKLGEEPMVLVHRSAELNACVYPGPDRPLVVLNSALVSLFGIEELSAVVAHEFGHALMGHLPSTANAAAPMVLSLFQSRAQEVSADRVGMFAADDFQAALQAEIRLACGLDDRHLRLDLDLMVEEARQLMIEFEQAEGDVDDTHPEYPFRLWSQWRFSRSEIFRGLLGKSDGDDAEEVEREIETHFLALAEGHATVFATDILHEAVAWIGCMVVAEDADIDSNEREVLTQLVGTIWADDVASYARRHGLDAVQRRAMERIKSLRFASERDRRRVHDAIGRFQDRTGAVARCTEMLRLVNDAWK